LRVPGPQGSQPYGNLSSGFSASIRPMEGNPRIGEERVAEVLHSRLSVPQLLVHHIDEHKQRRYGDDFRPAKLVEFVANSMSGFCLNIIIAAQEWYLGGCQFNCDTELKCNDWPFGFGCLFRFLIMLCSVRDLQDSAIPSGLQTERLFPTRYIYSVIYDYSSKKWVTVPWTISNRRS